ncbi:aggregation factor core [Roseibium sp. RKSG952]|uniref:aggregation factor core n=1 Tax=Roseibium sp. RKSG952 TaxID=2529384 RepID=UPI0012BBB149|nr:aggregation factor core [Roseibium sp. RKSG952]MTH97672.1 aggregation factor core [Roseibium sp. RKSG952]
MMRQSLTLTSTLVSIVLGATPATAGISIGFIESAPKDRFVVLNTSTCPTGPITLSIDLSESAGNLIFDTEASGAGVEVFQPFELTRGAEMIETIRAPQDGGHALEITLLDLLPDQPLEFTIDVDDTLPDSALGQTRVAGSEIAGGRVQVSAQGAASRNGTFSVNGGAQLGFSGCLS